MSTTLFAYENTTILPATCEDIRTHFARKGINVPRLNRMRCYSFDIDINM